MSTRPGAAHRRWRARLCMGAGVISRKLVGRDLWARRYKGPTLPGGGTPGGGGPEPDPTNDARLSNPRIDATGTLLKFDVASGTWSGLLQVDPSLIALTMDVVSITDAGAATTRSFQRRAGYRAEYVGGVLSIWLREVVPSGATNVAIIMATGAVTGPSVTGGSWTGAVSNASNERAVDPPVGRLGGIVMGRHDLRYGHDLVDGPFYIEAMGAHPDGVVVKLEATVGATTVTHWVTTQTRSRYQDTVFISDSQWTVNAAGGAQGGIACYSSPQIDNTLFPEGAGTITATFYSRNGGLSNPRVHQWPFYNNLGGYTERVRYVDTVAGSDTNDGLTPATAYATTGKAAYHAGAASAGATAKSIARVYLIGGTVEEPRRIAAPLFQGSGTTFYVQATDTWVTLEPAPGYAKETVVLTTGGQSRIRRLRFRNMLHDCANGADASATGAAVLTANNNSVYPTATNPAAVAMDNVTTYHHLGRAGQLTTVTSSVLLTSYNGCMQFWSNWEHTDASQRGFVSNGIDWMRNCYIHEIASDGGIEPECCIAVKWEDNKVPTYGLGGLNTVFGTLASGTTVTGLLSGVTASVVALVGGGASVSLDPAGPVAYAFKADDNMTHQEVVVSGVTGTFSVGETVRNATSTQTGIVRAISGTTLRVSMSTGTSFSGTLTGLTSTATATVSSSTTRGNLLFSNGAIAKLNLPHPDGIQFSTFWPQRVTLTNVVGTFQQGEFFDFAGVAWDPNSGDPKVDTIESPTSFVCNSGNEIMSYSAYRGKTVTGRTSNATATLVRVDVISNDVNSLFWNCAWVDIDGQIFFAENGAKNILIANCLGTRPDASSPSISKATTCYAVQFLHNTFANQPWGRQDTNPIGFDPFGSVFRFSIVPVFHTSYVPTGASSSDRAGSPGYDHYGNHALLTGVFGGTYLGLSTGQVSYVNGVNGNVDHDAAKVDYRPAAADSVCGLIPAGEVIIAFDHLGVARPNDGTATVGAFQRAAA
jgi:hypothetical protein